MKGISFNIRTFFQTISSMRTDSPTAINCALDPWRENQ